MMAPQPERRAAKHVLKQISLAIASSPTMCLSRQMWRRVYLKGETVASVAKDLHTQFRCVHPSGWKDAPACVDALNRFISQHDGVETVYTDNSRELIKAIEGLGSDFHRIRRLVKVFCQARSASHA